MSDPFAASVALHLPFDTSISGSSVVQDGAIQTNTAVLSGNAAISAVAGRFGGKSCAFDGTADYATYSEQIAPTTGDFTFEAWVFITAFTPYYQGVFNIGNYASGALFRLNGGGIETWINGNAYTIAGAVPTGGWVHVAWCRESGTLRTFVGGVKVGEQNVPGNIASGNVVIGGSAHSTGEGLNGYMNDARITLAARYTANFTPPNKIETSTTTVAFHVGATDELQSLSAYPVPSISVGAPDKASQWRDYYFGGRGSVSGTVKQKGVPSDTPVVRRVRLHQMLSGVMVAETWSDPTGAYRFDYLNPTEKYYAIAFDHFGNFRGVVADNLSPVLM